MLKISRNVPFLQHLFLLDFIHSPDAFTINPWKYGKSNTKLVGSKNSLEASFAYVCSLPWAQELHD